MIADKNACAFQFLYYSAIATYFTWSLQVNVNLRLLLEINVLLVFATEMEVASSQNGSTIMWFFRDKGFDDKSINEMLKKCKRLQGVQKERASENWAYLKSIGIQERKLPSVVSRCPKILTLGLNEKLVPMVECLATLGTKHLEVASAIARFPPIVSHSV